MKVEYLISKFISKIYLNLNGNYFLHINIWL